ncbi:LpqB family beta-propeller domain-containing protein [Streptomyces sp. TLI_171]|uniref:LpqB family beta-propeller domain-containing protein n=1 Tax=Streptomyces sp. TLI_171 TaxID=1938859 RepID=UPI000C62B8FC|nr:LpqB family beta-propeller domain-containing protein [Streptomyces sp. TLI_171]RKE19326.1 lipoprotein LpqB-like beta-propeller protein [Streptomyces sp. TLI_171]
MRRTDSTTDRRALAVGWAALLAAAATGCVAMPSGGAPQGLEASHGAADGVQVHVYPVAPHKGESPNELLAGFLDSSNADQANYDTAKQYLTAGAAKTWKPDEGVVVLAGAPHLVGVSTPAEDAVSTELVVSGEQVAALDAQHTYQAHSGDAYKRSFTFVKVADGPDKGEWRINDLPNGLIVDQTNFKNGYKPAHRYFFADPDRSSARPQSNAVLVPDPIYLRRRIDPLTEAAQATADGPSKWLDQVVYSRLDKVRVLSATVGDNRVATVKVDGVDLADQAACKQMAQQLFQTLADQQGKLDRLDLSAPKGSCSIGSAEAAQVAPGVLAGGDPGTQAYIQLADGRLTRYQDGLDPTPVAGVLGQAPQAGQVRPGAVAVRRDGVAAAMVAEDGSKLFRADLADAAKYGEAITTSRAPRPDQGLASPSWDGRQDLWLVDRDPAAPKVLMVRERTVVPVQVEGLGGRTVQSLRISSDGTRIALLLRQGDGPATLALGLVEHDGTPTAPAARIVALREIAPQLTEVAAVSWGDTDQLVVLGKETDRLQQLHFLGTDGSQSTDSPLQGGESMTALAATEARSREDQAGPAVLTASDRGLYRLKDNQWHEVPSKTKAEAFIYPG